MVEFLAHGSKPIMDRGYQHKMETSNLHNNEGIWKFLKDDYTSLKYTRLACHSGVYIDDGQMIHTRT